MIKTDYYVLFENCAAHQDAIERAYQLIRNLVAWIIPKDALSSCFSTPGIT